MISIIARALYLNLGNQQAGECHLASIRGGALLFKACSEAYF